MLFLREIMTTVSVDKETKLLSSRQQNCFFFFFEILRPISLCPRRSSQVSLMITTPPASLRTAPTIVRQNSYLFSLAPFEAGRFCRNPHIPQPAFFPLPEAVFTPSLCLSLPFHIIHNPLQPLSPLSHLKRKRPSSGESFDNFYNISCTKYKSVC